MALWNARSKYTQYDKNKKTEIVQKNIRSIYSQIKELSAHENLQNLLAEQNQDKSSEIRTLLHHQYPFTKKSSLYLWNDHDLQYWDTDRKSTRLNSSHVAISYAVFCLKKKKRESNMKT